MSNIVHLSQLPDLLRNLDECIVRIAGLRDTVGQALDTSWTVLDNLDNAIAAIDDSEQRSILERKRAQAREVVHANSRMISQALESMTTSARTIRAHAHEIRRSQNASTRLDRIIRWSPGPV